MCHCSIEYQIHPVKMTSISKTISDATSTVKDTMKSAMSLGKNLGITGNKDVGQLYYEGKTTTLSLHIHTLHIVYAFLTTPTQQRPNRYNHLSVLYIWFFKQSSKSTCSRDPTTKFGENQTKINLKILTYILAHANLYIVLYVHLTSFSYKARKYVRIKDLRTHKSEFIKKKCIPTYTS